MIARPSVVVSLDLPPVSRNYRDISCDDETRSVHHGECNLECLTRTADAGKRRSERNSCKSGESSGDMARQLSKIRWNLGEKANVPEVLPPQLVIRRFLPAFMRPFLAVFIGKIFSPGTPSESRRAGQRRSGTRASKPISCALHHPPVLHPAANALASRPYTCYLLLSLNILHFIYGCPSRFIVVRAALFALTCFVLL